MVLIAKMYLQGELLKASEAVKEGEESIAEKHPDVGHTHG